MEAKDIILREVHRQAEFGYEPSWEDLVIAGKLTGIREVVEWIEQQGYYSCLSPCECLTNNEEWQAKLKEWGL